MDADLIRKYDRPVPRYTSYPAATQFSDAVDAATMATWLSALPEGTPLSLYVHLPFCRQLCWFCGCHTTVPNKYDRVTDYVGLVDREAEIVANLLDSGTVRAIHWGGGTPTMLTPADIERLAAALWDRFPMARDLEFSVEVDPRSFSQDRAQALAAAGVTRVSVGVQDLTPRVQESINRIQTLAETAQVVDWLRQEGVNGINVDLMYGLPHQTVDGVIATAKAIVDRLSPDRLAVFGYAHVPWMKRHQQMIPEDALPDGVGRFEQAEAVAAYLLERGYVRIGFDHFARPGDSLAVARQHGALHRNFQGYTVDDAPALIGLGASAISALPEGYAQNAPRIDDYAAAIMAGRLATVRGVALTDEDRLRREAIERLMCDFVLDTEALAETFGRPAGHFAPALEALQPLVADGMVIIENGRIRVASRGRPFVRIAAAAFDQYLTPTAKRHARAI